jgi:raffinose/stachyose/melibiose transport system permease protein
MASSTDSPGVLSLPLRVVLWIFGVTTVVPFALLLLTSIKSMPDLMRGAFVLPAYPHFENYVTAWVTGHFSTYFANSVIVVIPVVVVSTFLGLITGFGFAYLTFPLRKTIFVLLTIGMMVPTEAYIIPLYYEMLHLNLINTYWALILPQIGMSIPFATLFMASALQQMPREVLEAAVLDGASRPQVLWRVLMPLLVPAISTLALDRLCRPRRHHPRRPQHDLSRRHRGQPHAIEPAGVPEIPGGIPGTTNGHDPHGLGLRPP